MGHLPPPEPARSFSLRAGHLLLHCSHDHRLPAPLPFSAAFTAPARPAAAARPRLSAAPADPGALPPAAVTVAVHTSLCDPLPSTGAEPGPGAALIAGIGDEGRQLSAGWQKNPLLAHGPALERLAAVTSGDGAADALVLVTADSLLLFDFAGRRVDQFIGAPVSAALVRRDPRYALRPLLPLLAARYNGAFLHSSAVVGPARQSFLFLAPSGGGKSTSAGLGRGRYRLLGDDHIGVCRGPDGGYLACATPFNPATDGPDWGELRGLCLLVQAGRFELRPLGAAAALARIWQDNRLQWASLTPALRQRLFTRLWRLLQRVPTWELRFPRHHIDWDALERAGARAR